MMMIFHVLVAATSLNAGDGSDYQLALDLDRQEREARRLAEAKEFEILRVSWIFFRIFLNPCLH